MTNIKDKIDNLINEGKYFENSDVSFIIRQLGEDNWSKGKKKQIQACKDLMRVAESDEGISNSVIVLTVVLVIIFVVLLIVLVILLTRRPEEKSEDFGETSYY